MCYGDEMALIDRYFFSSCCVDSWAEHGQNTGGFYKCNKFSAGETGGNEAQRAKQELGTLHTAEYCMVYGVYIMLRSILHSYPLSLTLLILTHTHVCLPRPLPALLSALPRTRPGLVVRTEAGTT
ncbi:hypothetical protein EON64_19645 [archaeon]|nr:MAG: hypothetical protein EON64_19645 [archaeon]